MAFAFSKQQESAGGIDFPKLESLRIFSKQILEYQVASLNHFAYRQGYQHIKRDKKRGISVSSTGTCVISLVATGKWMASKDHSKAKTKALLKYLVSRSTSASLPNYNPFTIAWILEAVTVLSENYSDPLDRPTETQIAKLEKMLQHAIKGGGGGVSIYGYPPSAYLTQLVMRVLRRRGKLTRSLKEAATAWAWAELTRQLALVQAGSKTADAFALAYLVMLVSSLTPASQAKPEETSTQRVALKTFFDCQRDDGTWPLSRPLFHYKKLGNAYCYEYETLTQLLQQTQLQEQLLDYLPQLSAAAESVSSSAYRLDDGVQVWTSGHHPNQGDPESWATASVYHFVHELDRLLAQAVRRDLFRYLESPLPVLTARRTRQSDFANGFLDCKIKPKGRGPRSLRKFLWEELVEPLSQEGDAVASGRTFSKTTPRSAIFFGPPGTSKTELSKEIAKFLGWPHLPIDPSALLRNGMEGIHTEANTIFRMLEQTERVVVLFDEFDELVRERESTEAEALSRFLTTAMLPKLASIHRRATLVFILATNNIGEFDLAIRRQGRFDRVVQIMPPTYDAKMAKGDWGARRISLGETFRKLKIQVTSDIKQEIEDLTYGECDDFATDLAQAHTQKDAISILTSHSERCTLRTKVSKGRVSKEGEITWKKRCEEEAKHIR